MPLLAHPDPCHQCIVRGVAVTYIDQCCLGAVTKVSKTPVHARSSCSLCNSYMPSAEQQPPEIGVSGVGSVGGHGLGELGVAITGHVLSWQESV